MMLRKTEKRAVFVRIVDIVYVRTDAAKDPLQRLHVII